jgi:hypothetical protein
VSKSFKHAFNPSNPELLIPTVFLFIAGIRLCLHIRDNLLPSLGHGLTLPDLSRIVILDILVSLRDDLFLHEYLRLLELPVPVLELREAPVDVLHAHVPPEALRHVELLPPLVQLPLDQLVVNAVYDQVLELTHVVDLQRGHQDRVV